MDELAFAKEHPFGPTELDLPATVELQTILVHDKPHAAVLSTNSGEIYQSKKIMVMSTLKDLNIQHAICFQCSILDDTETSIIQT
ncbi:unnamed protein product [Rotaria magnacalcarata]|uniref:Uncharacterized protein n=2 Tax=Rotaria magnacalcarata TaxID=392030 RepID=A0A814MMK9_9BILA|nr:unnamed protein product [Rotaria magnacalcarata]CAF1928581.1 unnamed protein product [Rotaria magnacalcarata]CAF3865608.1 unnamed protein product [Rotaria magnacalcarata]CAF3987162.1 unnamed protein product [Rotaria magnacalcarata]